jgi:membrane protein required for colicin V production
MNWLDFVLLAIVLGSVIMSVRKGFSREVIGLAASLAALVLGMWFYGLAGSFLIPYVSSPRVANLIGFLLVVFAVLICGGLVGWIVSRFLRTIGLSFFDRLLGAAFGFARGVLIAIALLTAFMAFGPTVESKTADTKSTDSTPTQSSSMVNSSVVNSRFAPYVLDASHTFVAIAPMELKSSFRRQYEQVKATLENNTHERKL